MKLVLRDGLPDLDIQDPDLGLTPGQQEACALDRELLVRAGAGAGKTHTLSIRHLRLMIRLAGEALRESPQAPRPDLDAVLVLTFTEKAAQEMAERCHRRLLELVRMLRLAPPPALVLGMPATRIRAFGAAIETLLDGFEGARISTFHGFCARLLREFPVETGVAPNFGVLNEDEASLLREDAVEKVFREAMDGAAPEIPLLLDAIGSRHAVMDAMLRLVRQRDLLRARMEDHAAGRILLQDWLDRSPLPVADLDRRLVQKISPLFEDLVASLILAPDLDRIRAIRAMARRTAEPPGDVLERYDLYREAIEVLSSAPGRTRALSHQSFLGAKKDWKDERAWRLCKQDMEDHQGRADALTAWSVSGLPNLADRDLLPILEALSRISLKSVETLEANLQSRRSLDFPALVSRVALALERSAELRRHLCERHRWIMVDEFQDTDAMQWSIVRSIGRPSNRPAGRIFLVGDPQQAIYGFRGGDVTVFNRVEREMATGGNLPVLLDHNFRSRPSLIHWYNTVFQAVLGPPSPHRPPWEAPCQPIQAGRNATGGTISAILHEQPRGENGAIADAEAIVTLLSREILPERPPFDDLCLHDRVIRPTPPIAILLKRRTWLQILENALRRSRIDYVVAGGVGFWSRPEVLDIANTFHALVMGDEISRVGALRSPLFGLTDQDILDLHSTGCLEDFGRLRTPRGLPERVEEARARYNELRALRYRLTPSGLVERIIRGGHAIHAAGLESPEGRAEANLERLLALVRGMETRGGLGMAEVARLLVDRIEDEAREQEAILAPDAARVVILTVHASKGLEFPVVVIPDLSGHRPGETDNLSVGRLDDTWSFACKVPSRRSRLDREDPGFREALRNRLSQEREAEDRRLLYVATTRAADHLVLIGARPKNLTNPPHCWMDLLLGTPGAMDDGVRSRQPEDFMDLPVPEPLPADSAPEPTPRRLEAAASLPPPGRVELSPSGLDAFHACPARWMRARILRLPERMPTMAERRRILAACRGTVLHGLLEDGILDDSDLASCRWSAAAREAGADEVEVESGLPTLLLHLGNMADHQGLRAFLAHPGRAELPFHLDLGDVIVSGVMDRVVAMPGQGLVVLDLKTGAVDGSVARAAEAAQRQIQLYQMAVERISASSSPSVPTRAALFFSAVGVLHAMPPLRDAQREDLLATLRTMAAWVREPPSWSEVEEEAIKGPDRHCGNCGYFHHGCVGQATARGRKTDD